MHEDYLFSGFRSLDEKRAGGGLVKETEMKRNQYSLKIILIFDKQVPITEFTF